MESEPRTTDRSAEARRQFLAKCGKLAIVTPPAVTLLLAQAERNYTFAQSGQGNNGKGNGGDDGVPGNSGFEDETR